MDCCVSGLARNVNLDVCLKLERHIPRVRGSGEVHIIQNEQQDGVESDSYDLFVIGGVLQGPFENSQYLVWNLCQKLIS